VQPRRPFPVLLALALAAIALLTTVPASATAKVTARAAQSDLDVPGDRLFPVGSPAMEAAKATAVAYWGAVPCGGQYTIAWTPLDPGTNATASWRNPVDPWNNSAQNFDCRIDLNPYAGYDYAKLCTVMTHEVGHLLGQPHAAEPGRLMSAYYSSALTQCETPQAPATGDSAGIDIDVAPASGKQQLRKKARTKKVRRCVVRRRSGKRVRVCYMVTTRKATKAKKAAKAKAAAWTAERGAAVLYRAS
jgi:hypothetical protein